MAGVPRRWIRLDVGWQDSEWLYDLEPGARLAWALLLDYVKSSGIGGSVKSLSHKAAARKWRVSESDVAMMLEAGSAGEEPAIELHEGMWIVTRWDDYQRPDKDQAAERKRKERSRKSHSKSRPVTRDTPTGRVTLSRDTDTYTNRTPLAADAAIPPAAALNGDAVTLLGNGGAEAYKAIGGTAGGLVSIRLTWLYESEEGATPDAAVKGKPLHERRDLVARALVDMQGDGKRWNPALFAGFVRTLKYQQYQPRDGPESPPLTEKQHKRADEIRAALEDGGMPAEEAAEEAYRQVRSA